MPQLKRTDTVFLMPCGNKRTLSVVNTIPDTSPNRYSPPPQVILTYGAVKRAYGRERLMKYDYKDVIDLFSRDFQLPRPSMGNRAPTLQVTFYRTHGRGGYDNTLVSIDEESWAQLMENVTRIDLKNPPNDLLLTLISISGGCVLLLFWIYLNFFT
ncbi:hypothetical protein FPV67DRAFT_993643 [Lyophyllum atratum]|nr:hypothetical protein FPV67DRAFT_993643 [Lyophyllum atratum]